MHISTQEQSVARMVVIRASVRLDVRSLQHGDYVAPCDGTAPMKPLEKSVPKGRLPPTQPYRCVGDHTRISIFGDEGAEEASGVDTRRDRLAQTVQCGRVARRISAQLVRFAGSDRRSQLPQ